MFNLGVDLGGTNIAVGVVENGFKIVGRASIKTFAVSTEKIVERICDACKLALNDAELSFNDIDFIGVGSPGAVNVKTGVVIYANNLPFNNTPLASMIEKKTGKKVYIDNDANAAAFGEYLADANNNNDKSLVAITLGTGIGGGVVIDGKLFYGHNYSGGELGHMVVDLNGKPCSCGRRGCFESYASVNALILQTKHAMIDNKDSLIWQVANNDINAVTGKTVFDALRKGDKTAKAVVEQFADYVAIGLVNIINSFGPAVLCIAGGISREGELLLEPVRRHIELHHPVNMQTNVRAALLDNDAGIIGAANLSKAI